MTTKQISIASWAGDLPDNLSYLAPTQFELLIKKLPNTKYFIGIGNSKKNAEQSAATECLNSFNK